MISFSPILGPANAPQIFKFASDLTRLYQPAGRYDTTYQGRLRAASSSLLGDSRLIVVVPYLVKWVFSAFFRAGNWVCQVDWLKEVYPVFGLDLEYIPPGTFEK